MTDSSEQPSRSGRVVVLALAGLIALWAMVLAVLLWRGVHSPRWLHTRDPDAPSESPELIVVPSRAPTKP